MDVVGLDEVKVRVERLLSYYRETEGENHVFVATLEARLANVTRHLKGCAEGRRA